MTGNEIVLFAIGALVGAMSGFILCALVYGAILVMRDNAGKDGQL